jgi:single-stranded-DNA-specific exonuclease
MAAGVTLDAPRIDAFRAFLDARFAADVAGLRARDALAIDALLTAAGATAELVADLERAGPFGAGSPEPVVCLPSHRLIDLVSVGEDHLRLTLAAQDGTRLRAMAFRAARTPLGSGLAGVRGELVHAVGSLTLNRWGGRAPRAELRLIDAAPAARPED